jgi:hypothetical protein
MVCGKEQGKYMAAVTTAALACSTVETGIGVIACGVALYGVADALDDVMTCKEKADQAAEAAAVFELSQQMMREHQRLQQKGNEAGKKQ